MRVLLPLPDEKILKALVETYAGMGWEPVIGNAAFAQRTGPFDLVHIQWPEALADWRTPTGEELAGIVADLAFWRGHCPVVATVHNLAPHGRHASAMDRDLFARVYEACHLVTHFSEYSRTELLRRHPALADGRHLVHRPFLYTDLLPLAVGRGAARARFGFGEEDFVIAATGHVREPDEMTLLAGGIERARVPGKRPYLATRHQERRRRRVLRRAGEIITGRTRPPSLGPLASPDLVALCEAADVLVIPRYPPHLNSGVMQLAMTFGTPMAVPDYGIYREYLRDAGCAFYAPKDAGGLARAIERIRATPRHTLVDRSRAVAEDWGWPATLAAIIAAIGGSAAAQDAVRPASLAPPRG
ncbi:MAG: hypothetical protein IT534_06205 [Bauldia sp.]|nr:hypothetical protein [Bauldia sp.]